MRPSPVSAKPVGLPVTLEFIGEALLRELPSRARELQADKAREFLTVYVPIRQILTDRYGLDWAGVGAAMKKGTPTMSAEDVLCMYVGRFWDVRYMRPHYEGNSGPTPARFVLTRRPRQC